MQTTTETKSRAQEAAKKWRATADQLYLRADAIEAKGNAYAQQSDEEILARLSSWDSYLRRTGRQAKNLAKWHNSDMYAHAMKLYRYLVRLCKEEAKAIDFSRLTRHIKYKDSYVRNLLALLQGKSVKVQEFPRKRRKRWEIKAERGVKLLPGFPPNERGQDIVTVKPASGRRPNKYAVAPPPQFEFIWEAEEAGLLEWQ